MTVEDTTGAMLPPPLGSPVAAVAPRPWYRDRVSVAVLVLVSFLLAGVASFYTVPAQWVGRILPGNSVVDVGAVALKPGSARPTDDRVQASDIEIFEPEGKILFTTVAVDDQVTIADWVRANSDDAVELRTREQVFGTRTSAEQRERIFRVAAAVAWLGDVHFVEAADDGSAVAPGDKALAQAAALLGVDAADYVATLADAASGGAAAALGLYAVRHAALYYALRKWLLS